MIQKVKSSLEKVDFNPYIKYGYRSFDDSKKNQKKEQNDCDSFSTTSQSNPFEEDKKENKLQEYYCEKYLPISLFIKNILLRFSKNGDTSSLINSIVIDAQGIFAKYYFNGTFPNDSDRKYTYSNGVIYARNLKDDIVLKIKINKKEISEIEFYNNKTIYKINLKTKSLFDRFLPNENLNISKCKIVSKDDNSLEEILYSKSGMIEKYVKSNSNRIKEVVFDTNNYSIVNTEKLIPLKYCMYDENYNKLCVVKYAYSLPVEYIEYDKTTFKLTKMFNLQGLKAKIYKYSIYSSLSGNLITSGYIG